MRIAGIGFSSRATPGDLAAALARAGQVDVVATAETKADALAAALGRPVRGVAVAGIETPSHSARVAALYGTGSVAEAAALACGGRLIQRRQIMAGGVTIALAETEEDRT